MHYLKVTKNARFSHFIFVALYYNNKGHLVMNFGLFEAISTTLLTQAKI